MTLLTPDGVAIFFVISGYLITHLLLREYDRSGHISMSRFYARRLFRIFPPIYAYLIFVLLYARMTHLQMPITSWLSCVFFVRNYSMAPVVDILTHTWSLAVEEQFYLLWPPALLLCLNRWGRKGATVLAICLIAASPLLRIATKESGLWFFKDRGMMMLHTRIDILMFGCLAALAVGSPWFERIYAAVSRVWWLLLLQFCVFSRLIEARFGHTYTHVVGMTIDGFCIMFFLVWCTRSPEHAVGRVLNAWMVRWVGVLSYSIYVWQTFFIKFAPPLWILPLIALGALGSYWLVETPARLLRDSFLKSKASKVFAAVAEAS